MSDYKNFQNHLGSRSVATFSLTFLISQDLLPPQQSMPYASAYSNTIQYCFCVEISLLNKAVVIQGITLSFHVTL